MVKIHKAVQHFLFAAALHELFAWILQWIHKVRYTKYMLEQKYTWWEQIASGPS